MFTGIVSGLGEVRHVEQRGDRHIVVGTEYDVGKIDMGASMACSGICLTVVDKGSSSDRWFAVTASAETTSRTTAGRWVVGSPVNLERPVRVGDELGGHIVTGHIDDIAKVVHVIQEGESARMSFDAPPHLARFIAPKGSIALDGVSLTVNTVEGDTFSVLIIPHTLQVTSFNALKQGDDVNLEIDNMARYAARLMDTK